MTLNLLNIKFENILFKIYISQILTKKKEKILIYIYKKLYFVNNFRVKMLIENNIINFETIIFNIINKNA